MKKLLILILTTIATGTIAAPVTLYGRVSVALENDSFPSNAEIRPGNTSVQDYGSYFGIRGTDLVYGQNSVVWQIEQFLNIASGEAFQQVKGSNWVPSHPGSLVSGQSTNNYNVFASSDSYIGVQGDWGRVRIGNLSNTFRTNTGAVDIFKGGNANIFKPYDSVLVVLPTTIRYDSPTWSNISFSTYYAFNTDGNFNTGNSNGNGFAQSGDMNGYNNAPIFGGGVFYQPGYFSATLNTQVNMNTGIYQSMGGTAPGFGPGKNPVYVNQGINAYVSRLEFNYNDPDGVFLGVGGQIAQGYGYQVVPGNGAMNNLWITQQAMTNVSTQYYNPAQCAGGWCTLNTANLGTAEAGISMGWHIDNWTPKIGYMYGSNMMNGGSPWDLIAGNNQIGATGYQQAIVELDWNITPRAIAFINYGQSFWGNTMNNMDKGQQPKQWREYRFN